MFITLQKCKISEFMTIQQSLRTVAIQLGLFLVSIYIHATDIQIYQSQIDIPEHEQNQTIPILLDSKIRQEGLFEEIQLKKNNGLVEIKLCGQPYSLFPDGSIFQTPLEVNLSTSNWTPFSQYNIGIGKFSLWKGVPCYLNNRNEQLPLCDVLIHFIKASMTSQTNAVLTNEDGPIRERIVVGFEEFQRGEVIAAAQMRDIVNTFPSTHMLWDKFRDFLTRNVNLILHLNYWKSHFPLKPETKMLIATNLNCIGTSSAPTTHIFLVSPNLAQSKLDFCCIIIHKTIWNELLDLRFQEVFPQQTSGRNELISVNSLPVSQVTENDLEFQLPSRIAKAGIQSICQRLIQDENAVPQQNKKPLIESSYLRANLKSNQVSQQTESIPLWKVRAKAALFAHKPNKSQKDPSEFLKRCENQELGQSILDGKASVCIYKGEICIYSSAGMSPLREVLEKYIVSSHSKRLDHFFVDAWQPVSEALDAVTQMILRSRQNGVSLGQPSTLLQKIQPDLTCVEVQMASHLDHLTDLSRMLIDLKKWKSTSRFSQNAALTFTTKQVFDERKNQNDEKCFLVVAEPHERDLSLKTVCLTLLKSDWEALLEEHSMICKTDAKYQLGCATMIKDCVYSDSSDNNE
jgi:hypothetical protein